MGDRFYRAYARYYSLIRIAFKSESKKKKNVIFPRFNNHFYLLYLVFIEYFFFF